MAYKSIHTIVGLQLMTQAEATGNQIRLTHIAVGDGNGNTIEPVDSMTGLIRERYRTVVNRVWNNPDRRTMFSAEMIIPATEGGFTLREVGVFDSNGNLFVVGNLPETYKPSESDGSYSDTVIRVDFMVTNASIIELMVDPNVVVATHAWIINNITPATLLPGGTTHQVLRKKSNSEGDLEWADPTDVNVTVNSIEETQTLVAGQTVIDWAVVNNTGLSVYVEGSRLRADQWEKHATINTRITLKQTYQAGTKVVGAQNEPANSLPDPLVKSKNLADVPDKEVARNNLDVMSSSETKQRSPAGVVCSFAMNSAPNGWLKCNGAAVSRVVYSELFAAIGTQWGSGDSFNTFNVPDLRGEFIRGFDDGKGIDQGRVFASFQADAIKSHRHELKSDTAGAGGGSSPDGYLNQGNTSLGFTEYMGGSETRPRNKAMLYCIKY